MTDAADLRLECLKLARDLQPKEGAASTFADADGIAAAARIFSAFVLDPKESEADRESVTSGYAGRDSETLRFARGEPGWHRARQTAQ